MRKLVVPFVALAAVLLAACGGSSKPTSGGAGGSTSAGASATTAGSGNTTGNRRLDQLLKKAKSANVKVTYKSSGSADSLTIAQYNGDSAVLGAQTGGGFYAVGGKAYACSGEGSTAQCIEAPGGASAAQSITTGFFGVYAALFTAADSPANPFLNVDTNTTSETIAGRDATCVTIKAGALAGASGSITACIDSKTGVLLKGAAGSGSSRSSIEATDFAASTAGDVKLPAEPQAMPTVPSMPGMTGMTTAP